MLYQRDIPVIIDDKIYNHLSLKDEIEILSDWKKTIEIERVINVSVKYLFAYMYPKSVDQIVPISHIRRIFWLFDLYLRTFSHKHLWENARDKSLFIDTYPRIYAFFKSHSYAIWMNRDIASTSMIFNDIISQNIIDHWWKKMYRAIDLWSWNWITTMGQWVQALRSWLTISDNVWIEIQESVVNCTNELLSILLLWRSVQADTTKDNIYNELKSNNQFVNYVCNETIPNMWIPMSNRNNNDPFFENISMIKKHFWNIVDKNLTQWFPKKFNFNLHLGISPEEFSWEFNNFYCYDELEKLNNELQNYFIWYENLYDKILPSSIEINGQVENLDQVWLSLVNSWKVIEEKSSELRWRKANSKHYVWYARSRWAWAHWNIVRKT